MDFITNYILICVLFYLIGSIPTAYLFVKFFHKKDITAEGSGNVGAMNSYEVSQSKWTGISVFIIDFLKGAVPAWLLTYFLEFPLSLAMFPLVLLVLGHNYSLFLKFKGGRGLATAAGLIVIVNFWLLIIWCVVYVAAHFIKKNVHIANVAATAFLPLPVIFFQGWLSKFTYENPVVNITHPANKEEILIVLSSSICLLILLKHIQPLFELIKEKRIKHEQKSEA